MDEGSGTIGQRLRRLRRWRGLSLKELADLAGVYPSQISTWENGMRLLDRRSHISALAAALKVSETDLAGGPHLGTDQLQSGPHAAIPALREALQANALASPAVDRARPLPQLAALVSETLWPLVAGCDFMSAGAELPAVLDELYWHAACARSEPDRRLALETLIGACFCAEAPLRILGYGDLAYIAALRAVEAAAAHGDPVEQAKASVLRLFAFPRERSWERRLRAAELAADALEPHARTPLAIQVLGMLTLSACLASAVLQRPDSAGHWLGEAGRLAGHVPDDITGNWQHFCRTNVALWHIAVCVERGEGGKVLEVAAEVDPGQLTTGGRRAMFYADVGRGLAQDPKQRGDAVRWLRRAEEAGPQLIRNYAPTRATVSFLLDQAVKSAGRELRGMAARMGMPH
jgi:transcriptional regulator with XRE-family HTH domain